jgi:ribosome-dependent ATPase
VPIKGSVAALAFGALLHIIASTGFGLLVSSFVRTQIAAIFAAAIATTVPAIQYSGYLLPVSSMSADAQLIGRVFPSTYFLHISVGSFTKALDWRSLVPDFAALAVIIVVLTLLSRTALKGQEA